MYQLCRLPSKDVRFNVTLSPTSTASEGPGTLSEVFVSPQPVLRLPYSWIGRSRAASAAPRFRRTRGGGPREWPPRECVDRRSTSASHLMAAHGPRLQIKTSLRPLGWSQNGHCAAHALCSIRGGAASSYWLRGGS